MNRNVMGYRTLATLLSIGAGSASAQATPPASVRDSITAFYRAWSEASMTRGAEGYASYFAADATLLPPNAGPVHGRDSIRAWMERTQREVTYRMVPSGLAVDAVHVYAELAIHLGTLKGQRVPFTGGSPVPFETKYFDVLQKAPTGGWQFRYRMWSDNQPPPNK